MQIKNGGAGQPPNPRRKELIINIIQQVKEFVKRKEVIITIRPLSQLRTYQTFREGTITLGAVLKLNLGRLRASYFR